MTSKKLITIFTAFIILLITFAQLVSAGPSSSNYELEEYDFGSGGTDSTGSSSTNYKIYGSSGDVEYGKPNASITTYVTDNFGRSSTNSWGSADTGGSYTLTGTSSDFDVNGSEGTMSVPTAGDQLDANLTSIDTLDIDATVKVKRDKLPAGVAQSNFIIARHQGSDNYYRARLRQATSGNVFVQAQKVISGSATSIGTEQQVTVDESVDTYVAFRVQFEGTNPTTIRMRAWDPTGSEPGTWIYTTTDSESALQSAGYVGLSSFLGGSTSNAPVLFTFDNFSVTSISSGGTYTVGSGFLYTLQAALPPAPTLSNPSNYYSKLKLVVSTGGNPSDAKFAISISSDNFVSDIRYVKNDNSVGSTLALTDWQTYTTWGGASGFTITGLAANTTYKTRVAAKRGNFTQTGFGPMSSSVATVDSQISFDIDVASTDISTNPPYEIDFGTLTPGSVTIATNKVWASLGTNANNGGMIYVNGLNTGLKSVSAGNFTITSATGDLSSLSTGYGLRGSTVAQTSGGPMRKISPYDLTSNNVGIADTTQRLIFDSTNQAVVGGRVSFEVQAKSSALTKAADDYTDTLTVVATGGF